MDHPPSPDEQHHDPDPPPQQHRLLTIQQTAEVLQVGRCTVQELVLTGALRSLKIGRLRRIPPEAIDEYVARQLLRGGKRSMSEPNENEGIYGSNREIEQWRAATSVGDDPSAHICVVSRVAEAA